MNLLRLSHQRCKIFAGKMRSSCCLRYRISLSKSFDHRRRCKNPSGRSSLHDSSPVILWPSIDGTEGRLSSIHNSSCSCYFVSWWTLGSLSLLYDLSLSVVDELSPCPYACLL